MSYPKPKVLQVSCCKSHVSSAERPAMPHLTAAWDSPGGKELTEALPETVSVLLGEKVGFIFQPL